MASEGPIVLDYHDTLLRKTDFESLNDGRWLNDMVISFAFEYFEKEKFASFSDKVAFISPDVTQMIKYISAQEAEMCLDGLGLQSKEFVVLAVNDSDSQISPGGSHWSSIVYDRHKDVVGHYDSYNGHNHEAACLVAKKIIPLLKGKKPSFMECPCPQQTNCSDCGVYVISVVEQLSNIALNQDGRSLEDVVTPAYAKMKRKELKKLIKELAG